VLYSRDSDDQGEFGIFKANNSVTAEELFVLVNEYINRSQRERRNFIENYIPSELKKLDNADARIIGDYVIFTILDENQSREIFSKATELLKVY
jgi:isocitrate dehydrogenase kinase/phosphatase